MMPRWKLLGLPTLLAAVLAVAPVWADSDTQSKPPSDSQKLDRLLEEFHELQGALATLEGLRQDVKGLREKTDGLDTRITNLQTQMNLISQSTRADVDTLGERLRRLERDMESLRGQVSNVTTRVSGFAPSGAAVATGTGRLRLRNSYTQGVTIVVDDKSYELAPGETQILDNRPAGPFTYEVLGIQERKTSTQPPNQTYSITVYDTLRPR